MKAQSDRVGDKVEDKFKDVNKEYEDAYDRRKIDEDKDNVEEQRLIRKTPTISLETLKNFNKVGKSAKNVYITSAKLEIIADHYGVKKSNREKMLNELYKITDFTERATRGYFPKNDGLPEVRRGLVRPLDIADFKPVNTPNTLSSVKKETRSQKGSGLSSHSTWRDQFI